MFHQGYAKSSHRPLFIGLVSEKFCSLTPRIPVYHRLSIYGFFWNCSTKPTRDPTFSSPSTQGLEFLRFFSFEPGPPNEQSNGPEEMKSNAAATLGPKKGYKRTLEKPVSFFVSIRKNERRSCSALDVEVSQVMVVPPVIIQPSWMIMT